MGLAEHSLPIKAKLEDLASVTCTASADLCSKCPIVVRLNYNGYKSKFLYSPEGNFEFYSLHKDIFERLSQKI